VSVRFHEVVFDVLGLIRSGLPMLGLIEIRFADVWFCYAEVC